MTRETGGRNGSGLSRVETLLDYSPLHAHPGGHYVVHFQQQLQRFLDVEAFKVESFQPCIRGFADWRSRSDHRQPEYPSLHRQAGQTWISIIARALQFNGRLHNLTSAHDK